MSIKENALIVSLNVLKPQMTKKDEKATEDAERANNAHGAGHYRKDLYPKALVQPINAIESSARAFITSQTYPWDATGTLLPTVRFTEFADRMADYELQFAQAVTAFLNNWSNVMLRAQQEQGDLYDAGAYPDLTELRNQFKFRVNYKQVTDNNDFRVAMQEDELSRLRATAERNMMEDMDRLYAEPLKRLRKVVAKLNEVAGKQERVVLNKRTGHNEIKPPIFRDSVVDNIIEELDLLADFSGILPEEVTELADTISNTTPDIKTLRSDKAARAKVQKDTSALLASIDDILFD